MHAPTYTPPCRLTTNTTAGRYALSACHRAAEAFLETKSTPLERDYARRYFEDADAMIAKLAGTQTVSARRREHE